MMLSQDSTYQGDRNYYHSQLSQGPAAASGGGGGGAGGQFSQY